MKDQIKKYLQEGYTQDQMQEWIKQQKVGYFKSKGLLRQANKEIQKEMIVKEKKELISLRLKQEQHDPRLFLNLEKFEEATKPFHIYKHKFFFHPKRRKMQKMEKKFLHRAVIARIELKNGFIKNFLVKEERGGFKYQERFFIFDNINKRYDIDSKFYVYEYHEDYCLPISIKVSKTKKETKEIMYPIDKKIPINEIKEGLEHSGITDVEYASNPSVLHWFMNSRVAEKILMGVDEDSFFRFMRLMIVIIVIIVVINLLFSVGSSGIFSGFGKGGS